MPDNFQPVRHVTVEPQLAGQRVDNYLFSCLKTVPKSQIYAWLRKGQIRRNGKRCKPCARLAANDQLRLPPMHLKPASAPKSALKGQLQAMASCIVHEDERVVVINKPSGLAAHGGSGHVLGALEVLRELLGLPTLGLAHRLDKDTSGCLVFAKHRKPLLLLHHAFRQHQVKKQYLACLQGVWQGSRQRIVTLPLTRCVSATGLRRVSVDDDGKESVTMFQLLDNFKHHCLVKAYPQTGRTHQIRVHAQSMGQSVLGDDRYARSEQRPDLSHTRLMLHAAEIRFEGELSYRFCAKPQSDWQAVIERVARP